MNEAESAWRWVKDTTSPAALENFIKQFGSTPLGATARARLEELKKSQGAPPTTSSWWPWSSSPTTPPSPPKAEPPTSQKAPSSPSPASPKVVLESKSPTIAMNTPSAPTLSTPTRDLVAALHPGSGQSAKDCWEQGGTQTCGPEMLIVPAGSFVMGLSSSEISAWKGDIGPVGPYGWLVEAPQHRVTIAKRFAVGRYAVTFSEWDACLADGACDGHKPLDGAWGRGRQPVINVSWYDAKSYVTWLSAKTHRPYRLLSEAEREYVTRAGTTTPFWWGPSISTNQANYDGKFIFLGSAKGEGRGRTLPVDSFQPNPWGLFQVHGNVAELVEDCWHDTYQGAPTNGSAWTNSCPDSDVRVVRGGSWAFGPSALPSARRASWTAKVRNYYVGFRVARTLE